MSELAARPLLRAWRDERGISQAEAAKDLGISQPAVAQWETKGRPLLLKALEVQGYTGGAVPATAWGYTEEQVERVRLAVERAVPPPVGSVFTASDFTVEPAIAAPAAPALDDAPPPRTLTVAREGFDQTAAGG